ncbi:MAG: Pvc16 family protein [Nostoc sp.]|uniref:Pvc16 family protein n=1 Tax=Nostoc sp. TaxID=1180 RepID=UPI002FF45A3B
MLPAVTQTLAKILASGTSLISTEQIDFNHPGLQQGIEPLLNLYCYDIREHNKGQHSVWQLKNRNSYDTKDITSEKYSTVWIDVSFLVSVWGFTALGEQRLLSEALRLLLGHRLLPEEMLDPTLRGYGNLQLLVCAIKPLDALALWSALGVRLRPALYVTVTIPLHLKAEQIHPSRFN